MGAMTKYAEISTMKIGIPIHTYGRRKWINKWAISESLQASVPKQGEMGGHWSENNLLFQWWIQGRGPGGPPPPPLFLDHTEVRRAEMFFLAGGQNFFFFETAPHPRHISRSGWPLPPPLSEGLNPPLYSHANKTHFHMKGFALSLVMKVRVFRIRKWPIVHRKRREIWMVYQHCPQDFPWENGRGERALGTRMLLTHLGGSDGKRIYVA